MISREERLAYCNQCIHKKESRRYGTLCGLTDNYPHFMNTCDSFTKEASSLSQKSFGDFINTSQKKKTTPKKKSVFTILFIAYIVIRLLYKLLKHNF